MWIKRKKNYRRINKWRIFLIGSICLVILFSLIIAISSQKAKKRQKLEQELLALSELESEMIESNMDREETKELTELVVLETEETIPEIQNVQNTQLPVLSPEAAQAMADIYNREEKIAYLTFDDGPSSQVTPLILDLLKANDIKATFFVLGNRVGINPDIVKRAYDEGHYIANHGYSHVYSKIYQSVDYVLEEYYQCEYEIRGALQNEAYESHLFRFPGGLQGGKYADLKQEAAARLLDIGVANIDWNCLTDDSAGAKTTEALLDRLINTSQDKKNLVILMHDAGDKILTYEMLQEGIDYLRNAGYTFGNFYDIIK